MPPFLAGALLWLGVSAGSGTLVVLNKAEATASLIDLDSGRVVATLPTGQGPHEAAASPDGRLVLAANYGTSQAPGSTLTVIDVQAARVVKTIDLGGYRRPHGVRWLADGRRAVVTSEASRALLIVDVDAGKVEGLVATDEDVSHMVVVTPDGARAFVANIGSGTVTAVDLPARKVLAQIATGKGAEGIDVTPDGREVWVTNREADTVSVIDSSSLKILATLESKSFPIRVKVAPGGRHALVTNARSSEVAVFEVATRKELRRVAMKLEAASGRGRMFEEFGSSAVPIGIVVSPDGKRAYVANANADVIAILDLEQWAVVGTLRAGREPDGMAYSPAHVKP